MMSARMPTINPRRCVEYGNQAMDDIGNWEKKETKGNIGNLGKVAQNINTLGFKIQGNPDLVNFKDKDH